MKLKKGDNIIVTIGKDKGKQGKVDQVLPTRDSVIVKGINMVKRHMKRRDERTPSTIVDKEVALGMGKVQLMCPKCKKPTRVGYQVTGDEKHRICRKCKQLI